MPQSFTTQAAKVMLKKEIQFPRQLGFVKSEPAGDRVTLEGHRRGRLNARDHLDCLFHQSFAFFIGSGLENLAQLTVAEVFLHNHAHRTVNTMNHSDRNPAFQKEARNVKVGMNLCVERLWINRSYRGALLPGNTKVFTGRSVRSERD